MGKVSCSRAVSEGKTQPEDSGETRESNWRDRSLLATRQEASER